MKRIDTRAMRAVLAVVTTLLLAPLAIPSSGETLTKIGSGQPFVTKVSRTTQGKLSEEDLHQISILGSRIVAHLNGAATLLTDDYVEEARAEIEKGMTLAGVVRQMLPVTTVETVVENSTGDVAYRHSDRVQDDQIPIFKSTVAVEVMEPILDAKRERASVNGIRLADADLLHTAILLDLDYVERRLKRASKLIDEDPQGALAQIVLAQTTGIRLALHEEDHPLVEAQAALRVAERMVEQERDDAAKANLQLVRNHLELYRGLMGTSADEKVRQIDSELEQLMKGVDEPGAAEKIRGFWNRLTGWFSSEAGQTKSTANDSAEPQDARAGSNR